MSRARLPALDGLRGLAIFQVVLWHYASGLVTKDSPFSYLTKSLSWTGVDLFFVLSGFLIGGILIDNRGATNYYRTFYIRRICRIFPLYFVGVAFFLIGWSFLKNDAIFADPLPFWQYLTFTQNVGMAAHNTIGPPAIGVTWSLAVEEQFYLLMPMIVAFVRPRYLPATLIGLIGLSAAARIAIYHWFSARYFFATYLFTLCRSDALLTGVLAAWAIRHRQIAMLITKRRRTLLLGFVCLGFGFGYMAYKEFSPFGGDMAFFGLTWIAAFYAALLLLAITTKSGIIHAVTTFPLLRWLGSIAFSLYLFHLPVLLLGNEFLLSTTRITTATDLAYSIAVLFVLIAVCRLSWLYFEKPIIRYGHSYKYVPS